MSGSNDGTLVAPSAIVCQWRVAAHHDCVSGSVVPNRLPDEGDGAVRSVDDVLVHEVAGAGCNLKLGSNGRPVIVKSLAKKFKVTVQW